MFIELILDDAVAEAPDRPAVNARVSVCQGVPAWPFRDGVAAALRAVGTNMTVYNTQRTDMNATFRTIVEEMTAVEETSATGAEKRQIVIEALMAAGWIDDSTRSEATRYIQLLAWVAKRPELLVAINRVRASSKCCISA